MLMRLPSRLPTCLEAWCGSPSHNTGSSALAVRDYNHIIAPNRRYTDMITHRLLKAALPGSPLPYGKEELVELARYCNGKEDDANKVERQVGKSAAGMLLESRIVERGYIDFKRSD